MTVTQTRRDDIAIVTVDYPPVNALGRAVREGLMQAVEDTDADSGVGAVVLVCAGRTFIAGADVREFDKPPEEPHLPDVLAQMEAAAKPWVAAIHGSALGGGLETALVCSHRIAAADSRLGFPEINLGLIPGSGGTVRLPRLIAAGDALAMIAGGKPVAASKALASGLVDAIADGDLLEGAIALAQKAIAEPAREPVTSRKPIPPEDMNSFEALAERTIAKARQQEAPAMAVQAVRNALDLAPGEALAAEREMFLELRGSPQAKALRHVFFAERATAKVDRIKDVEPRGIDKVAVIGGGTMGSGIAAACLLSGLPATLVERDGDAAKTAADRVGKILNGSLERGLIGKDAHSAMAGSFTAAASYSDIADADLVIEAVFEDMGVKQSVFAELDEAVAPDAVLATNTSYLDVNAIAAGTRHPGRVVGMHFFSPAHIMKLLEIGVPGGIDDGVLATAVAFAKRIRKIPVLSGICEGFIANRIMSAYRQEADYMLEDGALPWDVDRAMTAFGLPMGIFQMQDLAGLDIAWAKRKRLAATRDPEERYVEIADRLCEAGHFGRKTGRGWYAYGEDGKGVPSAETEELIKAESARRGIERIPMSDDDIMDRILAVMQAEGGKVLAEGIAASADDIDVVMVNAFGFPRWKGGPMFMAAGKDR